MTAREIIARAISEDISGGWVEEYDETADAVLTALTAAGYRILAPGDVDPETVDRCAQAVKPAMNRDGPYAFAVEAAIRALSTGERKP